MTEFLERTDGICSPPLCAVLERSSWPLLPGTGPPTRRQKPPLPRGRALPHFLRPGPLPLGQGMLLTIFDEKVHPLAKHGLEEPPWPWRLSVARTPRLPHPPDAQNPRRSRPQHLIVWIRHSARSTSSSDQVNSEHLSVFPSPGLLDTSRTHVLRVAPEAYQLFSPRPPVYWTQKDAPASQLSEIRAVE